MGIIKNNKNIIAIYRGDKKITSVFKNNLRIFSEKPIVYPYAIYETTSENQKITIVGKKSLFKHIKIVETNEVLNTNGDTSLSYTFSSVGEHKVELLFNDGLTSIQRAFYNCEYLKSVSEDLFANCTNVTEISELFNFCSRLTTVPNTLLSNCTKLVSFDNNFVYSGIVSLPSDLFENCPNLSTLIATFSQCRKLKELPNGLLSNCTNLTDLNATFNNCSNLATIPSDLFANCTKIKSFTNTFNSCSSLTSSCPVDNDGTPIYNRAGNGKEGYEIVTTYNSCFYNCTEMTDYSSIPSNWKSIF